MITSYGHKFIITSLALTVLCCLWAAFRGSRLFFVLAVLFAVVTAFLTYFYRNPARQPNADSGAVLSTADGRVLSVEEVDHKFIGGKGRKVSIFLSIFDAHVNRIPINGRVDYVRYNPGKFFRAFEDKASTDNENVEVGLTFQSGKMVFKIIAGILARRIEYELKDAQTVTAGEIFGMIHFGSRAELFLPDNVEILVTKGDRVKAGISLIGRITD
ncbi:MAG: phosphatidylserine decarboxylase family protein [Candidatus Zixiibacteriota bacterium]|nr:MAG: phosphatidylserine decarboxylase family protein [candidate division Zixibacteria bacterium]